MPIRRRPALKNKIQPSTFKDLIGFIKPFTNQAASHLAARRMLRELLQNGTFRRKRGGPREPLTKENKKKLIFRSGHLFEGGEGQGFLLCTLLLSTAGDRGIGGAHVADDLIGANQFQTD